MQIFSGERESPCTKNFMSAYNMCRIYMKANSHTHGHWSTPFITFLPTQHIPKLSDFISESGECLSLFIPLQFGILFSLLSVSQQVSTVMSPFTPKVKHQKLILKSCMISIQLLFQPLRCGKDLRATPEGITTKSRCSYVPMGWLMYGVCSASLRRWLRCFSAAKLTVSNNKTASVFMAQNSTKWERNCVRV